MNRKIKAKIKRLLLLFVLKHLEIVNPHNVSLSSACQISIQGVRQNWKPNFWSQNSLAHLCPPCLEEPEKELRQAKLSKKSLCVVKVFYDQSLFCIRKRKATPVTSKETVELPWQGTVLQTWLMEDVSTTRTVSISAGWLVKSPPCGMQMWLERLLQRRREAFWRTSTGQIPISRLPTLNQGSKSLSTTRSNSRETLPQVYQEAGITMYMNPSDTSETWIQTQMAMDGRGNGQLVDSSTREHYTAFRMKEAAFHFQIRWNIGSRFTLLLETNNTHTHTHATTTITTTTTSNNNKANKIYQTNSFQDTGNQVMKGNDFWEIKNKWDELYNYIQPTDCKEFLAKHRKAYPGKAQCSPWFLPIKIQIVSYRDAVDIAYKH